jgi:predicted Zn-dependent protease
MLCWRLILAAASFVSLFGAVANCQVRPSGDPTAKVRKTWDLGPRPAEAVEARDGFIDDPAILGYLQQLDVKLATAAGVLPMQVRLTRSTGQYARPRPPRALYVSAGLLDRLEDEAELAGLLAHELAHLANGQKGRLCDGDPGCTCLA